MNESGGRFGAVGDNGTSFGPWQLHVGGALPRGKTAAWANSLAGIQYALRQMSASGARGLTGRAAVNAIAQRFERPADPAAEERVAMGYYQRPGFARGGGTFTPGAGPGGPPPMNPGGGAGGGLAARQQAALALLSASQAQIQPFQPGATAQQTLQGLIAAHTTQPAALQPLAPQPSVPNYGAQLADIHAGLLKQTG
jgi:hypothetical protein